MYIFMHVRIALHAMPNYLCVGSDTCVCVWFITRDVMRRNKTPSRATGMGKAGHNSKYKDN